MRTKNGGGDFSKTVRTMASRMRQMPIFSRMSTRSRRVMPIPMITTEPASNQAIEQLKTTIKFIEATIIKKNEEYEREKEDMKSAYQRGDKTAAKTHFLSAKRNKQLVKSLEIQKSNTEAMLNSLESITNTVEKVQKLQSRVASQRVASQRAASTSRNGGKIMRKSKRRIRRIRKTRRHKI
jgi:hypothetical protein